MNISKSKIRLGAAILASAAVASATTPCDLSWVGTGFSAAPSPSGHLAVLRGNDGILRVNEWISSSSTWRGWTILPNQDGVTSEPWVSVPYVSKQNIFARKSDSVIQWTGTWNGTSWSYSRAAIYNEGMSFNGHIASASGNANNSTRPPVFFFANATDGTVKQNFWNGYQLSGWTDMGISGVVGSPYAEQVNATTFNVFVRKSDGSIWQKAYSNGAWSPSYWMYVPDNGMGDPAAVHTTYPFFYTVSTSGSVQSFAYAHGFTGSVDLGFPGLQNLSPVKVSGTTAYLYGRDYSNNVWRATRVGGNALTSVGMVNCVNP